MSNKLQFHISGFEDCPYYQNAVQTLKSYKIENKKKNIVITTQKLTRDKWDNHLTIQCSTIVNKTQSAKASKHRTSPFITCNAKFVGGYDSLVTELQKKIPFNIY
jgi:hypothetical protein